MAAQHRRTDSKAEFEQLQAESNQNRIEFLRNELHLCSTFITIAETEQRSGNSEHAAQSRADAETGYATLLRFTSDPKHAKHITEEQRAELNAGIARLRAQLDALAGQ